MNHPKPDLQRHVLARIAACLLYFGAQAQPLLDPIIFDAKLPRIFLRGTTGSNYVLESSADLKRWDFLFSGVATDGRLGYLDSDAATLPHRFYRAYGGSPPNSPPRTVTPKLDASRSVSTLASIVGGGRDLFLENHARITLNVRSNTLAEAEAVTMTPVTNVAGLPFGRGILGAVRIDAENPKTLGARTLGSSELVVTFGTNAVADRRQVVSFACDPDGSHFRLIPDRVSTTSATLVPTRSGIFGCCLATAQELNQFAPSGAASGNPAHPSSHPRLASASEGDGGGSFLTASRLCFPERVHEAVEIEAQLREGLDALAERMALSRAAARQSQSEDASDDSLPVDQFGMEACNFYTQKIKPLFPQVENNCSLLRVLAGIVLSLGRQIQLLGYEECAPLLSLSDLPVCPGARACLEEIKQCCEEKPEERENLQIDLLSIWRQLELLGLGECFSPAEVQKILEDCGGYEWSGWFRISYGATAYSGVGQCLVVGGKFLNWEGVVTGKDEDGLGLPMTGSMAFNNTSAQLCPGCCGTHIVYQDTTANGKHSLSLFLRLYGTGDDLTYDIGYDANKDIFERATYTLVGRSYDCKTCEDINHTESSVSSVRLPAFWVYQEKVTGTDTVQGTKEITEFYGSGPQKYKVSWNLVRRHRGGDAPGALLHTTPRKLRSVEVDTDDEGCGRCPVRPTRCSRRWRRHPCPSPHSKSRTPPHCRRPSTRSP